MSGIPKASDERILSPRFILEREINLSLCVDCVLFRYSSSACCLEKRKHPLPWQRWHLPAADHLRLTALRRATAPPAHITRRARWVDQAILWTPFLSLSSTPLIVPACLETKSLADPVVRPPLADTADHHVDTLVRELMKLNHFVFIEVF